MRQGADSERAAVVTTSWDDGHPLDVRLGGLLSSYGISGTFYVPLSIPGLPRMPKEQMDTIREMGMEIGSHTLTHPTLTSLNGREILHELRGSKESLEDMLGAPVRSLCYPKGKFNRTVRLLAIEAGYELARTTLSFRTDTKFDPYGMPVSLQFYPHTPGVRLRHALREGNLKGIVNWVTWCRMENDLVTLSMLIFEHILNHGGIFHIWGHSWEIDRLGLWSSLEDVLRHIAHRRSVWYFTNSQVVDAIGQTRESN